MKRQANMRLRTLVSLGIIPESEFKQMEKLLDREKDIEEFYGERKKLKDPEFTEPEGNPSEAWVIEENDSIPGIERGYEIVKEVEDGKYIMKRPNRHLHS